MPNVFINVFDKKKGANQLTELFTGSYEECEVFFNEELGRQREKKDVGNELYMRIYPMSHKSIEAVWNLQRLVLKNWPEYEPREYIDG